MNATRGPKSASRLQPFAVRFASASVFILAGYLVADVVVLWSRGQMLPTQAPPARPKTPDRRTGAASYDSVISRNMFNSDGKIPEPMIAKQRPEDRKELPPIPSQLPITLTGTLVHSNPAKSLAALDLRGKNQILSFRPGQDINGLATLESVERMKVFVRNRNTGRLEYIEMKNAPKLTLKSSVKSTGPEEVKKVSDTEFELNRSDLLRYTKDLSSILMQARVVPARRGGNGEIYGYRLVEMQPGSIYSQLGLQVNDVITGVNGTPVVSPQQAMELYTTLRNSNKIVIQRERGGRSEDVNYRIK